MSTDASTIVCAAPIAVAMVDSGPDPANGDEEAQIAVARPMVESGAVAGEGLGAAAQNREEAPLCEAAAAPFAAASLHQVDVGQVREPLP